MSQTLSTELRAASKNGDTGRGSRWLRLEQEYQGGGDEFANLADLYQMLTAALSGRSALTYLAGACPYADIDENVITVSLDFFVWPSSLDLAYDPSTNQGELSDQAAHEEHRSFDVIFDGSDYAELPFIGNFSLVPEMVAFDTDGNQIAMPAVTVTDSSIELSAACHTVLRADGLARGFRHTVAMSFTMDDAEGKEGEIKTVSIDKLKCQVTATYIDDGGEKKTETLELEIPPCVEALLAFCPGGTGWVGCIGRNCGGGVLDVYWNRCSGKDIATNRRDK